MQFPVRRRSRSPQLAQPASSRAEPQLSARAWLEPGLSRLSSPSFSRVLPPGTSAGQALPALRRDGPGRRPYTIGSTPDLSTSELRDQALTELRSDVYAASSASAVRARRNCIARILSSWGVSAYPVTPEKVACLGAGLKRGGYRSSGNVLSQYRVDAERQGQAMDSSLHRVFTDVGRACRRGVGPSMRAAPLPFERLKFLPSSAEPWVSGGPLGPRNAMITGSWWLLREAELSGMRAAMVTLLLEPAPHHRVDPSSVQDRLRSRRGHQSTVVHMQWQQRAG